MLGEGELFKKLYIDGIVTNCFLRGVMKKTQLLGLAGLSLAATGFAAAEIESSFHVGYSTDYVWRGVNQNNLAGTDSGLFEYGLDFTGSTECGFDWNAGVWLADFGDNAQERDFYASASKSFGLVDLELGAIRYDFDSNGGDTTELFLGAGTEFSGVALAAKVYYDVDAADGATYGELSASKSFELPSDIELAVSANYGLTLADYADDYYTYGLSIAASKELAEGLTGSIYVAGEITENHASDGDDLFGGASLAYSF
ncbi:MAG: TorF family putative porin [Verrucomicrobiales bacterium]